MAVTFRRSGWNVMTDRECFCYSKESVMLVEREKCGECLGAVRQECELREDWR